MTVSNSLRSFTSLEEFGEVHPREPDDKCLGDGAGAIPSTVAGQFIKLTFDGKWLTKIYSKPDNVEYAGGLQLKRFASNERMRVALLDGHGATIAVCIQMHTISMTRFKVYGTTEKYEGQKPSKNQKHGGAPLYAWANIEQKWNQHFEMEIAHHRDEGSAPSKANFGTEKVPSPTGPLTLVKKDDKPAASLKEEGNFLNSASEKRWELTVAPGIDPCMMVCLVATMIKCDQKRQENMSLGVLVSSLIMVA